MQGGQDHHDGQVGPYDCVKDIISVTEVVGRLAQHVQEDCRCSWQCADISKAADLCAGVIH